MRVSLKEAAATPKTNLWTISYLLAAGIEPSSLRYATEGMWALHGNKNRERKNNNKKTVPDINSTNQQALCIHREALVTTNYTRREYIHGSIQEYKQYTESIQVYNTTSILFVFLATLLWVLASFWLTASETEPERTFIWTEVMIPLYYDIKLTNLNKSLSIKSNMLLYWQKRSALCWETAAAMVPSPSSPSSSPPIPQSHSSCLYTYTETRTHLVYLAVFNGHS